MILNCIISHPMADPAPSQLHHRAARRRQDPAAAAGPLAHRRHRPALPWHPSHHAYHRRAGGAHRPVERQHPRRAALPIVRRLAVPRISAGLSPHRPFVLARPRERTELPRRCHSWRACHHVHLPPRPPPNTFRSTGQTAGSFLLLLIFLPLLFLLLPIVLPLTSSRSTPR